MDPGFIDYQHIHDKYIHDDCLYLIFEKLDKKNDRDSFGLTCHRFLDIQNSSCKSLRVGPLPLLDYSDEDSVILKKLRKRFTKLESLSLAGSVELSNFYCNQKLEKYGSRLRTVFCSNNGSGYSFITETILDAVASACPLLSTISLYKCSINNSGLRILASSCISLQKVDIGWCSNVTDQGIWYLNHNCRQLRALRISGCDKINGNGFNGFSTTLACLEAKHCGLYPSLGSGKISGGGLEYLNISYPIEYRTGDYYGLGYATNLKILDMKMCAYVKDADIWTISQNCRLLKEWNLSYCNNIKISGWESIGLYCQNLERLHVNRCKNFSDRGLLALGNGCRRLTVIYMTIGLDQMITSFRSRPIEILDSNRVTPYGIRSFKIKRKDVEIKREEVRQAITPTWAFRI